METQVRTPQLVFMQPQRLVVPLFQRPYVWNEENQWDLLWKDLARVAERLLKRPGGKHHPHFLGAVVLQQVQNPAGTLQERTIIDGQQRLTTLQLLFDALHGELVANGATAPALRLEPLIVNGEAFCKRPEDRFKVWPTNRDRPAFNDVMGAAPPVDHLALRHKGTRMVEAHRFFCERAREWLLADGESEADRRANAIETAAREFLQIVVIDLAVDENAQEIFETLNARGAQLTAADLIKNFVFQRLSESGATVEAAYERYWAEFETAFWESEISVGRLRYPRSSLFLNHWLVARSGEEVVARDVFVTFKRFTEDAGVPMESLLAQLDRAAQVYRAFIEDGSQSCGSITRLGLFAYRTGVLESEVIKPLVLHLLDPEQPQIPGDQLRKALGVIESWMVRRMLVRATTKNYNQLIAELIALLRGVSRSSAGDVCETFLCSQTSGSRYWPDDEEIRHELRLLPAYRRLGRGRLRMVLEAIEDHRRGWRDAESAIGAERIARGKYAIEHIMPRKWAMHWPLLDGSGSESDRDALIHTIGNLTLLTGKLNGKVSNGPWLGDFGKRSGIREHDVLFLNKDLLDRAGHEWTDAAIRSRSDELTKLIVEIWPVPEGHRSDYAHEKRTIKLRVELSDLISAGLLEAGATLTPRRRKFAKDVARILPDGRLDLRGVIYPTPSKAARALTGTPINGWRFFLADSKHSLRDLRENYLESLAAEDTEDDDES